MAYIYISCATCQRIISQHFISNPVNFVPKINIVYCTSCKQKK